MDLIFVCNGSREENWKLLSGQTRGRKKQNSGETGLHTSYYDKSYMLGGNGDE